MRELLEFPLPCEPKREKAPCPLPGYHHSSCEVVSLTGDISIPSPEGVERSECYTACQVPRAVPAAAVMTGAAMFSIT